MLVNIKRCLTIFLSLLISLVIYSPQFAHASKDTFEIEIASENAEILDQKKLNTLELLDEARLTKGSYEEQLKSEDGVETTGEQKLNETNNAQFIELSGETGTYNIEEGFTETSDNEQVKEKNAVEETKSVVTVQDQDSLYYIGDRGDHIVTLKEKLVQLGFASWKNPSQFYGSITVGAVNRFQNYYGFEESPVFTQKMLNKMDSLLTGEYRIGDSGNHIVELKENLVRLGFANWAIPTNSYGSITANRVKDFQVYYELPISGIADEKTRMKMEEILSLPYRHGDRGEHITEFKEKLVQLGFASWKNPSQFYGSNTINALNRFQHHYGLGLSEVVTQVELDKMDMLLTGQYIKGDRGDHVVSLKENLVRLGFANWRSPSNLYGTITSNVVKRFQIFYDLPVSGIVDPLTLKSIENALENNSIRYDSGDSGAHIVELKEKLVRLGFASWSNPTQYYGQNTIAAVNRFQSYYGLSITSNVTPDTFDKIDEVLNGPYNIGDSGDHVVELKNNLVLLGFASWSTPSGAYGKITSDVVKKFQRAYGLAVNGIADEITLAEIDNNIVKIFIDPGHGGKDPGGQGHGLDEKNIVLDIALKTANILAKNYLGVDLRLSRTDDTFYELIDRANMANDWNADYYVSLHTNALNGVVGGFESFIFNGKVSNEAVSRQKDIHDYLIKRMKISDRGMKRANFSVLRNTEMPSLLIEYMFIDNAEENRLLRNAVTVKYNDTVFAN